MTICEYNTHIRYFDRKNKTAAASDIVDIYNRGEVKQLLEDV